MESVTKKFAALDGIANVIMSSDFAQVLIVSKNEIVVAALQNAISYDEKYQIKKYCVRFPYFGLIPNIFDVKKAPSN